MLHYRVLGSLEVAGESGAVPVAGQKLRALLAMLLIHRGEVLSVDRLVDALWGEEPPRTASTSLHNLVSQLRKLLGPDALRTRHPGYALDVSAEEVDAARFEHLVAATRSADAVTRARVLREALALWRGSPYADVGYETYAQAEIRRLEELRLEALEARIDADVELGLGAELVGELAQLVEQHPLRERLRAQHIIALDRAGRRADGLHAYHAARRELDEQVGIRPGPALEAAFRSLLRPVRTGAAQEPEDHHLRVARAMLAGRVVPVLGGGLDVDADAAEWPRCDVELAGRLAHRFGAPPDYADDLARVAEYVTLTEGVGPLYDELHALHQGAAPSPVDRALAEILTTLRDAEAPCPPVVTTSFGNGLELALAEQGLEFDIVSYLALGTSRGRFFHIAPDGGARVIDTPNSYAELSPDRRPVVIKIHGRVDHCPERAWESFVVTEDDHIDYLAQSDVASALPVTLSARLRHSHFLFLGYRLRHWSLRVFLHRLFGPDKLAYRAWAVDAEPDALERKLCAQRGIDAVLERPEAYMRALAALLMNEARVVAAPA